MSEVTAPEPVASSDASTQAPQAQVAESDTQAKKTFAMLKLLDREPDLLPEIEMVIREHLRKGVTPDTLLAIASGLGFYLGEDDVWALLALVGQGGDREFLDQAKTEASPQTWNWLRRLLALHGAEVEEAGAISGEDADSWRGIQRRAYYDTLSANWGVTLEITKYNGDRLSLRETPRSALSLARAIVDTLTSVPPEVAPDLIPADSLGRFAKVVRRFSDLYAPGILDARALETRDAPAAIVKCPHCGQEGRLGAKFCGKCGQPFDAAGEQSSGQSQP